MWRIAHFFQCIITDQQSNQLTVMKQGKGLTDSQS